MKLAVLLVLTITLLGSLVARKKQIYRSKCSDFNYEEDCSLETHCRWSYQYSECFARHGLLFRRHGILVRRPYPTVGYAVRPSLSLSSPLGVSRPLSFSRPSFSSVSRPSYNTASSSSVSNPSYNTASSSSVSRPAYSATSVSSPSSVSRPSHGARH